jgi:hypothetical protein
MQQSLMRRMLVTLLLVGLTGIVAYAKQKESITFATDVKVNGTLIKKGTYDVSFDDQSNELSIMKGSKVLAKTSVKAEKRDGKAKTSEVRTKGEGSDVELISVTFSGSDERLVATQSSAQSNSN